jgi:hypothetical protein
MRSTLPTWSSPARITVNSSPPRRASVSVARTQAFDAARRLGQQGVAHRVAEAVVDFLEVVEVEEQQRQEGPPRSALLHFLAQPVHEHVAVGQAGQLVEIGLVPDQLGDARWRGDVGDQRQRAEVVAGASKIGLVAAWSTARAVARMNLNSWRSPRCWRRTIWASKMALPSSSMKATSGCSSRSSIS